MSRGEVWWADLGGPAGHRPVLLLSRNRAYQVRTSVTVAALTTTIRGIPVEVRLGVADGVPRDCVVNCDEISTIPKSALEGRICSLDPARMGEVDRAIRYALDLSS